MSQGWKDVPKVERWAEEGKFQTEVIMYIDTMNEKYVLWGGGVWGYMHETIGGSLWELSPVTQTVVLRLAALV